MDSLEQDVRAELPPSLRPLVTAVLGSLDERGLATRSVDELADDLNCPSSAVRLVLEAVRMAGPPGIAAPSPVECLLAQARWLVANGQAPPVVIQIVADHLELVASGNEARIAVTTGQPLETVGTAVSVLRTRMRPWVTWGADGLTGGREAAPDVIVRHRPDAPHGLAVDVTDRAWFGLRLAELPPGCAEDSARRWMQPWLHEARVFLQQLEARSGALRAVAIAIVDAQHEFLSGEREVPRPLTRTAVASSCDLSVSTVSRVVQGKTLQSPDARVMALDTLFDPTIAARHAVRRTLERWPGLTDSQVSERLAEDGLVLARRTVAKYRSQLGITPLRNRPNEAAFA
jgi:RNA polymerase sigma-54 factor